MFEPIYQEIIKPQMMEKRVKEKSDSDKVKRKSSDTKTSEIMPRISLCEAVSAVIINIFLITCEFF